MEAIGHWALEAMGEGDPEAHAHGKALSTLRTAVVLSDLVARGRDPMAVEMLHRSRWDMACEPCQAEYRRHGQEPTRWPGGGVAFEPTKEGLGFVERCLHLAARSPRVSDGVGVHMALEAVADAFWPDLGWGAIVTTNAETRELMIETLTDTYLITVRAMVKK